MAHAATGVPRHGVTVRRLFSLRPSSADLVDAGFLLALSVVALLGLRSTYDGTSYLVVGIVGVLIGLAIAHVVTTLRQPVIVVVALALLAFFLLGGALAVRGQAVGGVVPTPATLRSLADVSVHGWKDLLTTLPPVDGSGPLLVLPYVLGLLAGAAGFAVARRLRSSAASLAVPVALLVAVIVLGTRSPGSRWVQGGLFAVLALGWVGARQVRRNAALADARPTGRRTTATTMGVLLLAAGLGAAVVGPVLPGSGGSRTVFRNYVVPPFDIGAYPSPLAGYRSFTKGATPSLYDSVLFTVSGEPGGTFVRIATLDSYDGTVWGAADVTTPGSSDVFQRVGRRIVTGVTGRPVTLAVTISQYGLAWLPDAGTVTGVSFHGADAGTETSTFRYNLATDTGIVPGRFRSGDSYTVRAVLPAASTGAPVQQPIVPSALSGFVRTKATQWAGTAADPMARITALGTKLRATGAYTDGDTPAEQQYTPGHYAQRLTAFLASPQPAGDDEQYAAAYALMINSLGYSARVVLGATPSASGEVRGSDVRAAVEVALSSGGWALLGPDTFTPDRQKKPDPQTPPTTQQSTAQVVPPPVTQRPPTSLVDTDPARALTRDQLHHKASAAGSLLPGWLVTGARWVGPPVLLVAVVCGAIVGLKARRRSRRRTRGSTATRLAMGWREVVDHARDLGADIPRGLTRREEAGSLGDLPVAQLARTADAHVFGPGDPAEEAVQDFWGQVEAARRHMSAGVGRWRRLRASLSLRTLLRPLNPA